MKIKKVIITLLFTISLLFLSMLRVNADGLISVSLESQENSTKDSIRYISTMENVIDLSSISRIEMHLSLTKDTEEKTATKSTTKVYSSVAGPNGKEAKENTYYSVFTITDIDSFEGYTLSCYFSYKLTDNSNLNTNTIVYDIPKSYSVTYHLNGGTLDDTTSISKASFTINYYNSSYWTYYASSIFLYDNAGENALAALYSKRIGINQISDNTYRVSHIYNPGETDKNIFQDEYAIVIHTDNTKYYSNLDTIEINDTIVLSEIPTSTGSCSILVEAYKNNAITKKYTTGDTEDLSTITEFTVSMYNVTNAQYSSNASSKIMLNDNETENVCGALYSYRVSMDHYQDDLYIVKNIYASGTSDYNKNIYDYTLVVHSSYKEGYNLITKLVLNNLVEIKNIPSASGACSLSCKVYDKTEYDSKNTKLETPSRSGYTFMGWYNNPLFTGEKITTASTDTSLYAKWAVNSNDAFTTRTQTDSYVYGNDVSYYQGTINMTKYKANSNFMIARIGYSTDSDTQVLDSKFTEYVNNAISNNVDLGLYIYSKADTVAEAKAEASWIIAKLKDLGYDDGVFSYPIYMDYEETKTISTRTKAENTSIVNAFAQTLIDAGYYPGLYMGGSAWNSYINQEDVICDVWVASYFEKTTIDAAVTSIITKYASSTKVTMIQFGDGEYNSASLSGSTLGTSSTYVDQDVCFVDYPSIIKSRHFNGY